jgi:hypothetical protein
MSIEFPMTRIIDVAFVSYPPTEDQLSEWRQDWIRQGWSAVTSLVEYQTVGYPYRVTFRGIK